MEPIVNPNVPVNPSIIRINHPTNGESFLCLPANNFQPGKPPGEPPIFGIHHLTALTACHILTGNPGFLSESRDRDDAELRVSADPDAIITSEEYYYHLTVSQLDPLYPICLDFRSWTFPHNQLPQAWQKMLSPDQEALIPFTETWDVISTAVKMRDKWQCRVSNWRDNVSTAHIIPASEEKWLGRNKMNIYASENRKAIANDRANLFALRSDLQAAFDQAKWVIVPKGGEMVIHFIDQSFEAAALYHNQRFDTTYLSHEFLFGRFAWAIMKQAGLDMQPCSDFEPLA